MARIIIILFGVVKLLFPHFKVCHHFELHEIYSDMDIELKFKKISNHFLLKKSGFKSGIYCSILRKANLQNNDIK